MQLKLPFPKPVVERALERQLESESVASHKLPPIWNGKESLAPDSSCIGVVRVNRVASQVEIVPKTHAVQDLVLVELKCCVCCPTQGQIIRESMFAPLPLT